MQAEKLQQIDNVVVLPINTKNKKVPLELFKFNPNEISSIWPLVEDLIQESCNDKNLEEENINHNKNIIRKKIIINNILNILPNIPTVLKDEEIHAIINHISNIYLTSTSMAQFYNNVNNSDKISPVNSNYVKLILYLIDNFDSSLPIDFEPKINKSLENKKTIKPESDDNMFLISNSNSPIQSRMMQQASFIH